MEGEAGMTLEKSTLPTWKKWVLGARPKTLLAAAAPVIVGTSMACWNGTLQIWASLAALGGALWLQIGANLANDVFDYQRGTDAAERLGPKRVTQEGWLSPRQVFIGTLASFLMAALCGLYLISVAGWPILVIGLTSILSALVYSGGPYPVGYHGLGDVFVFLYFGVIGVSGTFFAQAGKLSLPVLIASVPVGLLIVNILVVNNYRDIRSDRLAGKITLAVRLGKEGTRAHFRFNLAGAYLMTSLLPLVDTRFLGCLLVLASLPFARTLSQDLKNKSGQALNKTLAGAGKLALSFAVLFSVGGTITAVLF